jgi:hypothetical protein
MQDKQKVTLYLPPELHRRLKIRSAVDVEPMSAIVERAIGFYLTNPEVVEEAQVSHGRTHRIYNCPECTSPVALRDGEMVSLSDQPGLVAEELPVEKVQKVKSSTSQSGEEELVPVC